MNLLQLRQEYFQLLGERDLGTGAVNALVPNVMSANRQINESVRKIVAEDDWSFLRTEGRIRMRPPYTTGTVTFTTGTNAVTGIGTTWDRTMEGQLLEINDEYHRVLLVTSTTALTTENLIIQASVGGAGTAYNITFDVYELPYDFLKMYHARQLDDAQELSVASPQFEVQDFLLNQTFSGVVDRIDLDFKPRERHFASQGTITATLNSTAIVGAGTQFVTDQLAVGDPIRIATDDRIYIIGGITNATAMTLRDPYTGPTTAGLTYAVRPAGLRRFRLFDYPENDSFVYMEYKRTIQPMIGDNDTPDPIPVEYHYSVILKLALVNALQQRRLSYQDIYADYQKSLMEMKQGTSPNLSRHGVRIRRWGEGAVPNLVQTRANQVTT